MLEKIINELSQLAPESAGVLMAILISTLRVIYDNEETNWIRILLESLICGCLALAINSGLIALGFGDGWGVFIGGLVGYLGSANIKTLVLRLLNKHIDSNNGKKK